MSDGEHKPDDALVKPLTRRESEILVLLDEGFSAPEIAEQLTLAVSSVKWYIQQLYGKLGVNGKRPALTRAKELGLLNAGESAVERKPADARLPGPRHNLPLQVTRFFGREAEISQLKTRLSEHRLVTLTGSGGVGKTRLSLRVAEELLPHFPDGVWLVELAPLSDPALVPQQVAASLSLHDEPGRPILETLARFLRGRQVLLVLDNCEHLLAACAQLVDSLLRACPRLRLLASSREPLGVAGEAVVLVPSLPFPDQKLSPEQMGGYASVGLFVDRAHLVLPDYQVAAHNAAALAHICQRLDGIPLALEMAASRLRLLNTEALAGRLDDAFRLLTSGSRSALPRQQTLRATIDWSYDLLGQEERLLFERLSVFAGGFTLEAAESVCSGEGLEAAEVLARLGSLVEKSLVVADRRPGQEARYRLLEVVRQYAREKLTEAGDSDRLRTRHRDYFIAYSKTNVYKVYSRERLIWIRRVKADRDNLRQALEWSFSDPSDVETGPRLVLALPDWWSGIWSSFQEYFDWHTKAVAWCEQHVDISPTLYASVLGQASHVLAMNDAQAALRWAERAVDISRGLGPEASETLMGALLDLGWTYMADLSEPAKARPLYAEAEAIVRGKADYLSTKQNQGVKSYFAHVKAALANGEGEYQAAKALASESIRLRESSGDRWQNLLPQFTVGVACLHLGEFDEARDHFLAALDLIEEIGDFHKSDALRYLGTVDWRAGQLERALQYCRESLREAEKIPDRNIMASCLGVCAGIAAKAGQPERAARLSGASKALYARQGRKPWENSSLDTILPDWRNGPQAAMINSAFEAGLAMGADEAIAYALGDDEA
jgi:predicted ATPase/DNA-binding CsgD family transcriptional regulator